MGIIVGQEQAIPRGRLRVLGNRLILGIRMNSYNLFYLFSLSFYS